MSQRRRKKMTDAERVAAELAMSIVQLMRNEVLTTRDQVWAEMAQQLEAYADKKVDEVLRRMTAICDSRDATGPDYDGEHWVNAFVPIGGHLLDTYKTKAEAQKAIDEYLQRLKNK